MKCVLCKKAMETVFFNNVKDGGEITLSFCYGSREFDLCFGTTDFRGHICDECAALLVDEMERV